VQKSLADTVVLPRVAPGLGRGGGSGGGGAGSEGGSNNNSNSNDIRQKLQPLSDRFVGFEAQLVLSKNKKRNDYEREIQRLQTQITNITTALNLESKNRASSFQALQSWLENRIDSWTVKIEEPMIRKLDELNAKVDSVSGRVGTLEEKRVADQKLFPKLIDARAAELLKEIKDFKLVFDSAQQSHEEHHDQFMVRLVDQGKQMRQSFESEKVVREKKLALIANDVQTFTASTSTQLSLVKQTLRSELAVVRAEHEKEVQEREQQDSEITQAVNHYAAALQDAIKVVSQE
jgi:hypothetical protein